MRLFCPDHPDRHSRTELPGICWGRSRKQRFRSPARPSESMHVPPTSAVRAVDQLFSGSCATGISLFLLFTCRLQKCSLRGLNPRPMAHKTIALTTELRELGPSCAHKWKTAQMTEQDKRGVVGVSLQKQMSAMGSSPCALACSGSEVHSLWAKWRTQPFSLCEKRRNTPWTC